MNAIERLFGTTAPASTIEYPRSISLKRPIISTHDHPRDTDQEKDGRSELIIPLLARAYGTVIGIGNTSIPLTTPTLARDKAAQWRALIPKGMRLDLRVAGLMTESMSPEEIVAGYDKPDGEEDWLTMKMFIRAASNANGKDVDDVSHIIPCIRAMTHTRFVHKKQPMVLQIHMERKFTSTGERIFFLEREQASVARDLAYILKEVPDAVIIICHVTLASTIETINYYRSCGYNVFGEIAPHYSMYCADDLFEDGNGGTALNSHLFCLPIPKTPNDMRAIGSAMVSGDPWWLLGPDGACWVDDMKRLSGVKTNAKGITVGGQTQIPMATISYILEKFVEAGRLPYLDGFLSGNASKLLGLTQKRAGPTFVRSEWTVPETISRESPHYGTISCRVARGGQICTYQLLADGS
jgi:dihydroorotase